MNDMNFIESLFKSEMYRISRHKRFNNHNSEVIELLNAILQTGKQLNVFLDENGKRLFSKYEVLQRQYVMENEYESFAEGFRLGAKCMLDTFVAEDDLK